MLTNLQQRLGQTLDGLLGRDGFEGALLVSRDGFTMLNRHATLTAPDTFSAMVATMFGASEAALTELGEKAPSRIVIASAGSRLVAFGAGTEVILVVQTSLDVALEDALDTAEAAAKDIQAALGR